MFVNSAGSNAFAAKSFTRTGKCIYNTFKEWHLPVCSKERVNQEIILVVNTLAVLY